MERGLKPPTAEALLLGIDGGGSGVRLHILTCGPEGLDSMESLELPWPRTTRFEPLPIEVQLAEVDQPHLGEEEQRAAAERIECIAQAVSRLVPPGPRRLRVGVALAGRKDPRRGGILVALRGPRMPHFARDLEEALAQRGLALDAPLTPLLDDGDAAVWGELFARGGLLTRCEDAYLVAIGSGVAEGLLRGARPACFALEREALAPRLASPWSDGTEERLGMAGLSASLGGCDRIGERALAGDGSARSRLTTWARELGTFIAARAATLAVEQVVIGARGGELLAEEGLAPWARAPLTAALATGRPVGGEPLSWVASRLRAAPAIGAAAAALQRDPLG